MIELTTPSWLFDGQVDDLDSRVLEQSHWWITPDHNMIALSDLTPGVRQQLLDDLLALAYEVLLTAMVDATTRMDDALASGDRIGYQLASDRVGQLATTSTHEAWLMSTPLAHALGAEL